MLKGWPQSQATMRALPIWNAFGHQRAVIICDPENTHQRQFTGDFKDKPRRARLSQVCKHKRFAWEHSGRKVVWKRWRRDLEDIGWPEKGVRVSVLLDGTQLVRNPWSKRLRWSLPGSWGSSEGWSKYVSQNQHPFQGLCVFSWTQPNPNKSTEG